MIVTAITTSFLDELGQGLHNLTTGGDTFKCALYEPAALLDATSVSYNTTNEVSGSNYTAGGRTLVNNPSNIADSKALFDFQDLLFINLTVSNIGGCLIYNATNGNRTVATINFGATYSPSSQNFRVIFPSVTSTTAFIRISNNA